MTHQQSQTRHYTEARRCVQAPGHDREPLGTNGWNGLAVAGFVLALLGALSSFIPLVNLFGDVLAFLGLFLGVVALAISRGKGAGRGLAIAAITFALAALLISVMVNIAAGAAVSSLPASTGALVSADVPFTAGAAAPDSVTSSCAAVKDALLNGTPDEVDAGMLALVADATANPTARQYAAYYTDRDKDENEMQRLEATIIQSSCS